jgi:SAM-dependent methyltransferase
VSATRTRLRAQAKRYLPDAAIGMIKRLRELDPRRNATVAEGWDRYARKFRGDRLGDEWNTPAEDGLAVAPAEFVAYLDREVFGPFLRPGRTLLEIGPGGGRFTEVLLSHCDHLIAADTSNQMLQLLRRRFSGRTDIRYIHLDGTGLVGVEDRGVDAVFSYGVFVHLQHWDIFNYLSEVYRVLRPGGQAIIQHSNTFSEDGWQYFLKEVPLQLNRHKRFGTYTVMTPEMMAEFGRRAGLEVVGCRTDVVRTEAISFFVRPEATR